MTPYLQLLLNRKRNDPTIPYDDPNDPQPEVDQSPQVTIPLRSLPQPVVPATDTTQPPQPAQDGMIATPRAVMNRPYQPFTSDAPVITKPRDVIQEDRDRLLAAQNKPRSKLKAVGEGLADWAGNVVGLPVHRLIHPGGTDIERAQRQLGTDIALQKQQTENQDTQSTIQLRSAQARKIDADLNNPDTSDVDRKKLATAKMILDSHPQPFNPDDPADAVAIKKLEDAGIPIPPTYGKQPKEESDREVGGRLLRKQPDGSYKPVYEPPNKPEKGSETPEQYRTRLGQYRAAQSEFNDLIEQEKSAAQAKDAAIAEYNSARLRYKENADIQPDVIAAKTKADIQPDVIAAKTKADKAQSEYADFWTKKNAAKAKMVQYGDIDGKGNPSEPSTAPAPSTHGFSVSAWLKSNKGKTKADAQAFHDANYPDYKIVP